MPPFNFCFNIAIFPFMNHNESNFCTVQIYCGTVVKIFIMVNFCTVKLYTVCTLEVSFRCIVSIIEKSTSIVKCTVFVKYIYYSMYCTVKLLDAIASPSTYPGDWVSQ